MCKCSAATADKSRNFLFLKNSQIQNKIKVQTSFKMGREENQVRVAFEIDDNYFDRYYELSAIVT